MLQDVKSYLGRCFAIKDLGEAAYILGIKIYQDRSKLLIGLCQSAYIEKILKRYFMENSKRRTIPMQENLKLSKSQGAVDWKSMKQSIFSVSSIDAEYIVAFDASKEVVWIHKFIYGIGVVPIIKEPINIYCENSRDIAIVKDQGVTKGVRHFHVKVYYLRETIKTSDVRIEKVDTYDNLADPFMKALAFPKHSKLTKKIGMIPASSLMLNIKKLDGNIVQKHEGSKQVGFKQLGPGVETGVHEVHDEKRVCFEVELRGAQRDREAEVFQLDLLY
nr:hypothetical protein [Tanacetum cinerariifolium]